MESQKCMLDHSSSYSIHISCKRLITSVNLEVYATYHIEEPVATMIGSRKRVFLDSHADQQNKRCKTDFIWNPDCTAYYSIENTFITSKYIDVCGIFQLPITTQLDVADTELTTTESLIKSFSVSFTHQQPISVRPRKLFQSLRIDNEVSFPTTTATETLIKSTDINTQGTYQLRSKTDLDIMAVSRLFHGIEAMTSLGCDEFNSLEISGDTLVPDVSKSQR